MNKLAVILIATLIFLSGCGGAESRKEKYLLSGHEHYHQGDCIKAKLDYKNALQIDPKTVDALVGLSRCAIEDKEWRNAYKFLLAALDADENSVEAKMDLAKIYLISGDSQKSYEFIEEVLTVEPDNATAIALRGIFHLKNNTLAAARKDSELALSKDEDNLTAITLMSSLSVNSDQASRAIDYIESQLGSAMATKRHLKELRLMLIALYTHIGDTDNLVNIYKQLVNEYPDNNIYQYRLAAIYANNNRVDDAEKLLLTNIETNDDKLAYIAFLDQFKSSEQATEKLEQYAESDEGKLTLALAKRYLKQGKVDQAKSLFKSLSEQIDQPEHLEAKNELAVLSLKDNDQDQALTYLQQVLSDQPGNLRALMLRGTMALAKRDAPTAIADFRTVLRDQPDNTFAVRQLAVAYILNDQQDLARQLLQKAVEIDANDKKLSLLYARLQGSDEDYDAAIGTVSELLKHNSDDLETIKTLFDLQIANKDFSGAKQTAESMKSVMSDSPMGYYLSGVLLQNENNPVEAEKQYLLALDKQPRATEALSGLVRLYLSQKQQDKAIGYLKQVIDKDPEYLVPYNLLGEVALSKDDYVLATDSFNKALQVNQKWWVPYRGLSLTYLAQNQRDAAIDILEKGYNRGAGIERLGVELAQIYYQEGKRDKAINKYQDIIRQLPNSVLAKNNLAMILIDDQANKDDIAAALNYAKELESVNEPASLDTVGWVNYMAGNSAKAIEFLERAVALAPDAAELHYHLGMAYKQEGSDSVRVKKHLKIAAESSQEFPGKKQAIAAYEAL